MNISNQFRTRRSLLKKCKHLNNVAQRRKKYDYEQRTILFEIDCLF